MTNQDKKAWLRRYVDLNRAINQKLLEIEGQRALCEKVTAVITDMPKGGGSTKEDTYIKLCDMITETNAEVDRYVDMRKEIVGVIRTAPGLTYQTLLSLRYLDGKTWEQIAVDMNYTYQWVCKLHGDALNEIQIVDSN
ncbi:hypothetical protein SAMN02745823_03826 [Sporobacter termitidis DSM 10068]|uniref:Phage transcriptional activator, RinA family n=1 Tax=Sporobacter termitidis DSM 10068 TaxID=1123282 RepID=A0A1M5ZKA2_9FIRM|nr:hypothetical protein [Sporobacter termitidis]SHI24363.1 hypothetical protein SAMN02745823_03826 [Sporobacter termitidis DSM 10068]